MDCLDFVEIFGGCHAITRAMREFGYMAESFDIRSDARDNCHTEEGLMRMAVLIARLHPRKGDKPPGAALVQPTCSSWGWVNRGTSLRNVEPQFVSFSKLPFLFASSY